MFSTIVQYRGIIIVYGGPKFVAFVRKPCPQIYITTNLCTCICLIFIKILANLLPTKLYPNKQGKFLLSTNIDPHKKKMIPQYMYM